MIANRKCEVTVLTPFLCFQSDGRMYRRNSYSQAGIWSGCLILRQGFEVGAFRLEYIPLILLLGASHHSGYWNIRPWDEHWRYKATPHFGFWYFRRERRIEDTVTFERLRSKTALGQMIILSTQGHSMGQVITHVSWVQKPSFFLLFWFTLIHLFDFYFFSLTPADRLI